MNNQTINPMFAKFDQVLGKTTPTTPNSPVSTRADEIRNLAQTTQADQKVAEENAKLGRFSNAPKDALIGFGEDTIDSVNNHAKNIEKTAKDVNNTFNDPDISIGEKTLKALSGAGHVVGDVAGVVVDAFGNAVSHIVPDSVKKGTGDVVDWMATQINNIPGATDKLNWVNKVMDENPDLPKSISDVFNTTALLGGSKTKIPEGSSIPKPKVPVYEAMNSPIIPETITKVNNLPKIKEMISPKPTVKEAKFAMDQGRLIKGQEPTMFKSGTPDKIATSDQELKSSMTIDRLIPDAVKMDEPTLHSALEVKIGETAKALEPEMRKTPIKKQTVQKITDEWENLKKSEIESADADNEANVLKSQKQFENRLKKSKSGNMNDLWNTAKEYDSSIPDNVKRANSLSSESLQNKKALWLERRAIIRDAITDTENGLGETAKRGFSDMKDMYEAQNGIMSKAKVGTKVEPSKIRQAYDSKTGQAIRTVTKVGVGIEGLKRLSGF